MTIFRNGIQLTHIGIKMYIQQTGTAACKMRDELSKAYFANKITHKEITDRMIAQKLPKWLQSQILKMCKYRQYDRITNNIEQAMEKAVHYHILDGIIKKERKKKNPQF